MKTNTMKQFKKILLIAMMMTMISCGGGGSSGGESTPPPPSPPPNPVNKTISGSVVDGPIYGATVKLYNITDTAFASPLATATTSSVNGKVGDYSFDVKDLPKSYIIKVSGGKDTGIDGIVDDNDEVSSFELSSVGLQSDDKIYVSPATSLLAQNVISGQTIDEAKASLKTTLGLPDGVDLTTLNPKINQVASKAGTFVAQLIKAIPTDNKNKSLKSIAKVLKTDNKKVVEFSNDGTVSLHSDLDLVKFADDMGSSISASDKAKVSKIQSVLKSRILSSTSKIEAVFSITPAQIKEAKASLMAFDNISKKLLDVSSANDLNVVSLNTIGQKTEEGYKALLNSDKTISVHNLSVITKVLENNLDKDISAISANLGTIADASDNMLGTSPSEDMSNLVLDMFQNISIENASDVGSLKTMSESSDILDNLISKASQLSSSQRREAFANSIIGKIHDGETITINKLDESSNRVNALYDNLTFITDLINSSNATDQKIGAILNETLNLNILKNIVVDTNAISVLKNSLANHSYINENNITKFSALKFATIITDLNNPNPTIDNGLLTDFENKITALDTYDMDTSLICIKAKILEIDTNSNLAWNSLDIEPCKNIRIRNVVNVEPPLPPLSLMSINEPISINQTLKY